MRSSSRLLLPFALLLGSVALADAPAMIPMQGYLTDTQGEPVTGATQFAFSLYSTASGGAALYSENQTINLDEGSFAAYLGDGTATSGSFDLALFDGGADVWVGIAVAGGAEMPRFQLGTVPYAAYAEFAGFASDADTLGGVDAAAYALSAEVQPAITGDCDGAAISAINSDGTVECSTLSDGDVTAVSAGSGLTGGGTEGDVSLSVDLGFVQARVTDTCPAGQAIRAIDAGGGVTCEADDDTTYSAGSGLSLSGTSFSVDTAAVQARVTATCPAGQAIRAIDAAGGVTCEPDDVGSSYTAGAGLTLSGTSFSVDTAAIQARISGTCPSGQAITAIDAAGKVTCEAYGAGTITEVVAGTGLTGGGTSGSVTLGIADDSVAVAKLSYGVPMQITMLPNALTTSCSTSGVGGANFGSTSSTTAQYIGNLFYNETSADTGLRSNYARARLQVQCRGSGTLELMSGCSSVLADITCSGGARPWTASSDEFDPGSSGAWNLRVTASSGTIEWANPTIVLY